MNTSKINGLQFENMIRSGLANLRLMEETVNNLNVFPVADGDTGTNMCLTLENGINYAGSQAELGSYLKSLSQGMLLGARGNSGVILSQFFKGLWQALSRCASAGAVELRTAFVQGYRAAYASVVQPVEGTILTVAREGVELIRTRIDRSTNVEALFSLYINEMRRSLTLTTQRLPALREAGVVDSGAMGFVIIAEGMLKWLNGEVIRADKLLSRQPAPMPMGDFFHEDSVFEKGYCMEFILQLLRGEDYSQHFRLSSFVKELQGYGDSLAVVQDETRIKVHIHTKKPAKIMRLAQEYGEFVSFKLDNMQIQHNEQMIKKAAGRKDRKKLGIICVANGQGSKQLFEELGCDVVLDGGSTMNSSSSEFMDAIAQINAETVLILPNHKNNEMAALQAVKLCGRDNIRVLPSRSIAEGYFAIAMDVADSEDSAFRIAQIEEGLKGVFTLAQTTASRSYTFHEISCRAGDEIVLINDSLACVSSDWKTALIQALHHVEEIEDKETCVVFRGKAASEDAQWALEDALQEEFPNLEATFVDGGQDIYPWILGIT